MALMIGTAEERMSTLAPVRRRVGVRSTMVMAMEEAG